MSALGKNNKARLRSTINKISESAISHSFDLLTPEALDWFKPLYENQILGKSNPKVHDIYANTLGKESKFPYYILVLRENDTPIGATIFSKRKDILSIAYRIYPNNWSSHILQASPSLYTEYLINTYGHNEGYTKLSHGKDRNPYGLNASIGLALFKLSVGCSAFLPSTTYEKKILDLATVTEDILIFKHPDSEDTRITHGYLYVSPENLQKFENVTKYPNQITIEVLLRE